MASQRKGQVEVQFNWIFVVIIGAIILGFFVSIAVKQKEVSVQKVTGKFFTEFDKYLSGIASTPGKMLLFEIPSNTNLHFECSQDCECVLFDGESRPRASIVYPLEDKIVFAPQQLKGIKMLTWSKEWAFPFRVTNFVLMTSPEVKYLIEDSPSGLRLLEDLPPIFITLEGVETRAFDKATFDPEQMEQITGISGNYKVKFVFTDTDPQGKSLPSSLRSLPNSDVTAIMIGTNSVSFYEKTTANTLTKNAESYVFGEATELAAVFAEDQDSYSCMMKRAMGSLHAVASVYLEKQKLYAMDSAQCNSTYSTGISFRTEEGTDQPTAIGDLIVNSEALSENFIFDSQTGNALAGDAQSLDIQNENIIKLGCPQIY